MFRITESVARKCLIVWVLVILFPLSVASGEESPTKVTLPTYGDGTPILLLNPFVERYSEIENKTKNETKDHPEGTPLPTYPPGWIENNNWGQYMKDFYRSGRYLTTYDPFGATSTNGYSPGPVRVSPIMLHKDEVENSLCRPKLTGEPIYYCTIVGDDTGRIVAMTSREIPYTNRWEVYPQIVSPISSFAASDSISSSTQFWVATKGGGGTTYPVLEYRNTYLGDKPCSDAAKCTVVFNIPLSK